MKPLLITLTVSTLIISNLIYLFSFFVGYKTEKIETDEYWRGFTDAEKIINSAVYTEAYVDGYHKAVSDIQY